MGDKYGLSRRNILKAATVLAGGGLMGAGSPGLTDTLCNKRGETSGSSYFIIDINDPPAEYFPLPFQKRLAEGNAGPIEFTNKPLRHGKDTGIVYWDVYINAIIQKALRDTRTHDGDYLWSGGSLFFFPAGRYHLYGDVFFYDTDPSSPKYGQCWSNVNILGQGSATKLLKEGKAEAIYMTGYCGGGRYESAQGAWMQDFWSQGLDICFGLYDEDFERLHGARPTDPKMTHGIWSFYVDKLYVHTGGIRIKRLSSDICIINSVFDYGKYSIDIRDQVYSVTIQNNHFWNIGQRVRLVHSTERFDWQKYFTAVEPHQREGYRRGGLVLIVGNRDNSPQNSVFPADEGAFHIENCDTVVFSSNYSQDTRQPIDVPVDKGGDYGGRLSSGANFCNGRALNVKNCRYVNVGNNIFGAYWPAGTGVVTFDNTHYSSIANNIFTPIGGMNRERTQLSDDVLANLPEAYAIEVTDACSGVQVKDNVVEEVGSFRAMKAKKVR